MTGTTSGTTDEPTNVKKLIRVADAVSEDNSIAKDGNGSVCSAEALGYLQTRPSQATGENEAVPGGDLVVENLSKQAVDVIG